MSGTRVTKMKLPFLRFSSYRPGKLSRKDAKVFAEACQLALLRLEQCIADSYICVPRADERWIDAWMSTPRKTHEPVLNPAMLDFSVTAFHNKDSAAPTAAR
jgi:hypothetical protein